MSWNFDIYQRIEPNPRLSVLDDGFRARAADPLWYLTRQWQFGEHRGEDAASPVRVDFDLAQAPLDHASRGASAMIVPTEALIEAEAASWWTTGRRVLVGRRIVERAAAEGVALDITADLALGDLPAPYDRLDPSGADGRSLAAIRAALGLPDAWFEPDAIATAGDSWDPEWFEHRSDELSVNGVQLHVERHDGGSLGWYSLSADSSPPPPVGKLRTVLPNRLQYPGAPNPRWWELESSATDIGAYSPDRSHFATLLLIEIVTSHSDNWFVFPVTVNVGNLATVANAVVTDSFGEKHPVVPPPNWNLYDTEGLTAAQLLFAPTALNPLEGEPIEIVDVAVDEQANVVWAVERRVGSQEVDQTPAAPTARQDRTADPTVRQSFDYLPSRPMPKGWHPYILEAGTARHRFIQARLHDPSNETDPLTPAPMATLLADRSAASAGMNPHSIAPAAIPIRGLELTRRYRLTRATDGSPVLWLERRTEPRPGWTSADLAFDLLEPH